MRADTAERYEVASLASSAAVGFFRDMAVHKAAAWGMSRDKRDDLKLIVAELAANAVEASPHGAEIRFAIRREAHGVTVAVWDSAPGLPAVRPIVELAPEDLDLSPGELRPQRRLGPGDGRAPRRRLRRHPRRQRQVGLGRPPLTYQETTETEAIL